MASPSTWIPNFVHATHNLTRDEVVIEHHPYRRNSNDSSGNDENEFLVQPLRPESDNVNIQSSNPFFQPRDPMMPRRRVPQLVVNRQPYTPFMVESMRRKLRFYFMDPVEKWKARRQFPWKLLLQIIKILVVTIQLALFGNTRYSHMNFYEDNRIALCNIFLKNWDSSYEVETYPPSQGPYALYTKEEFYNHIDHIVTQYASIHEVAIGSYDYVRENLTESPITICKTFYKKAVVWGFNESFIFDGSPMEQCLEIFPLIPLVNDTTTNYTFGSKQYFADHNFTIKFERLISAEVRFSLRYILLKALDPMDSPDCFQLDITVVLDNKNHDGGIRAALTVDQIRMRCYYNKNASPNDECRKDNVDVRNRSCIMNGQLIISDPNQDAKYTVEMAMLNVLNCLVIFVCFLSLILCSRAIIRAQTLKIEAVNFFQNHYGKTLTVNDRFEFVNIWYIMIIINDVLIIGGSVLKIEIENKATEGDLYNMCSVLLGTGSLLVWVGVLRYLGFFKKYNILVLTMRKAVPDVLRFLLCAILMYSGFVFCGWLIFGPYHIKFRSLSSTAECLFSLINGDDMYATFTILSAKSGLVWWYSRIYMYSFIALFIYVVLSLFIAVIMDTYETIKMCYEQGFPKSDLMEFAAECQDDISSGIFRQDSVDPWGHFKQWLRRCCARARVDDERRPLLHGDK
ncbi:hypothetical protein CHUAL_006467 [Chamberlinius hualienensis]